MYSSLSVNEAHSLSASVVLGWTEMPGDFATICQRKTFSAKIIGVKHGFSC